MIAALGWVFAFILAIFIPRTVLAIVVGVSFGGAWWWLFAPLAIGALWFDLSALAALE